MGQATQTSVSTKRIKANLLVAVLAFVTGVFITPTNRPIVPLPVMAPPPAAVCDMPSNLQPILAVHFCDLMADSERYDGQVVRFEAFMVDFRSLTSASFTGLGDWRLVKQAW